MSVQHTSSTLPLQAAVHWQRRRRPAFTPPPRVPQVQAMVISPTRELAQQTFKVAESLVATLDNCAVCLLVGGTDVTTDMDLLAKGANILIGTPGRLDDVIKRSKALSYKAFEVLVLDEADRLLEMGFQRQLDAIMTTLPKQRRTGLFSATQTVRHIQGQNAWYALGWRLNWHLLVTDVATVPLRGTCPRRLRLALWPLPMQRHETLFSATQTCSSLQARGRNCTTVTTAHYTCTLHTAIAHSNPSAPRGAAAVQEVVEGLVRAGLQNPRSGRPSQ